MCSLTASESTRTIILSLSISPGFSAPRSKSRASLINPPAFLMSMARSSSATGIRCFSFQKSTASMACISIACSWPSAVCYRPPFLPTAGRMAEAAQAWSWMTSTLMAATVKGGFDYFINRGNCQNDAANFNGSACLQLTNTSPAVTTINTAQVPGRLKVNGLYFSGGAVDIDCLPNSFGVAPSDFEFDTTIFESAVAPYLRFNCPAGVFNIISLRDVVEADSIVGYGTSVVDAQNGGNIFSLMWSGGSVGNANQPLFIVAPSTAGSANALILDGPFSNQGNTSFVSMNGLGLFANSLVSTTGNGRVVYGMPTPPAPGAA